MTTALGGHATTAGSFILMEFAEFKPVTYPESETSSLFLEKPVEIAAYQRILGALAKTALGEGESRQLMATLATRSSPRIERIMMTAPEPDRIIWHTSSYSNAAACVEVDWRTSSYSGTNGGCVEVAPAPDAVVVRDSKDLNGPALTVPTTAWRAFLTTVIR